jgi:hypothetical protein
MAANRLAAARPFRGGSGRVNVKMAGTGAAIRDVPGAIE